MLRNRSIAEVLIPPDRTFQREGRDTFDGRRGSRINGNDIDIVPLGSFFRNRETLGRIFLIKGDIAFFFPVFPSRPCNRPIRLKSIGNLVFVIKDITACGDNIARSNSGICLRGPIAWVILAIDRLRLTNPCIGIIEGAIAKLSFFNLRRRTRGEIKVLKIKSSAGSILRIEPDT